MWRGGEQLTCDVCMGLIDSGQHHVVCATAGCDSHRFGYDVCVSCASADPAVVLAALEGQARFDRGEEAKKVARAPRAAVAPAAASRPAPRPTGRTATRPAARATTPGVDADAAATDARAATARGVVEEAKAKASARADAQAQADARSPPRKGGSAHKKRPKGANTTGRWAAALLPALMAVSQLRNSGWVRLPAVSRTTGWQPAQGGGLPTVSTATVLEAIRDPSHPWQGIFNGERPHAHASDWTRFHGASDRWEPQLSHFIGDTLQHYGMLECADGRRTKHVAYCHALRSKAMAAGAEGDAPLERSRANALPAPHQWSE